MPTHIETCTAAAAAARWTGKAATRLVMDARSSTPAGFQAQLKEANDIRSLIEFGGPAIRATGQDTEGAVEHFVALGASLDTVRRDTVALLAAHESPAETDTSQYLIGSPNDPYLARAYEIDRHKRGAKGG